MTILKIKLLNKDAKLPAYVQDDDAGFDLYSRQDKTLKPGRRHLFKLAISSAIPRGWFVLIRDRSGLAAGEGLHTLAGVIDSGYRGEWGVVLVNLGQRAVKIEKGDRIAQAILLPAARAKIVEAEKLPETRRGKGGFGSTGRR